MAGSVIVCLHGSLQHEVIHGHPTRSKPLNEWLVYPALGMWLPYEIYRDTHLKHHQDEYITDPFEDPESYYVPNDTWNGKTDLHRYMLMIRNTLVGRLLFGPVWAILSLGKSEITMIAAGDLSHVRYWIWHIASVSLLIVWLRFCEIPMNEYILLMAYPGMSLTMLRSFLEHQVDPEPARRTVIVESSGLIGLLFLNNNLHALHHEQPAMPWYRLPGVYASQSNEILARNGGYYYPGYLNIIRRYLLSPKTHPRHPFV